MATHMDPAVFRDLCNDVRQRFPVSAVAGSAVKLQRCGHEWKACCPFHADRTPSFTIFKGDSRWHCFGCGATGDVIDFVRRNQDVGLIEAVRLLDAGALPAVARELVDSLSNNPDRDFSDAARRIWQQAAEVREETPAYRYLVSRSLGGPVPPVLRYARLRCKMHDGENGPRRPALVALVVDVDSNPVGVQRTFLTDEGRKAFEKDSKLSLGQVKRGAIRLAPAAGEVCLAEGMETALSLQRMSGVPTWASAGSTMLPAMVLPADIRTVTIGADADPAGERTAQEAAAVLIEQGRTVHIIRPAPGFDDFNSEHQAEARNGNRY